LGDATRHFQRFFDESANGECVRLALRASTRIPPLGTEIALTRDVVVTLRRASSPSGDAVFEVEWTPADESAFPRLEGVLEVERDGDAGCSLVLRGSYEPPAGYAGSAFESAVGHRIAQATARDLLARIRDYVEQAYATGARARAREDGHAP
jgi:hypothetical protein